jgi:CRISPR-associated protein (Cas_Csd1).
MSWLKTLVDTYDNCIDSFGSLDSIKYDIENNKRPLLPPFHTTRKAFLEIILSPDGELIRISPLSGKFIILPCTFKSDARANQANPHALCDNLEYLAPGLNEKKHKLYLNQLFDWAGSEFAIPEIKAVYFYLSKGSLLNDLKNQKILKDNLEANKDDYPALNKAGPVEKIMVSFIISDADGEQPLQFSIKAYQSWIKYFSSKLGKDEICFGTGEKQPLPEMHPKYIRRPGDAAKLISSNDKEGFTFRGLFDKAEEACTIGAFTSQKAHNALKWLIDRQSFKLGNEVFIAWSDRKAVDLNPYKDFSDEDEEFFASEPNDPGGEYLKDKLEDFFKGRNKEVGEDENISIMALNTTTDNDARLSISFFKQWTKSKYFENINYWFETFKYPLTRWISEQAGGKKKRAEIRGR